MNNKRKCKLTKITFSFISSKMNIVISQKEQEKINFSNKIRSYFSIFSEIEVISINKTSFSDSLEDIALTLVVNYGQDNIYIWGKNGAISYGKESSNIEKIVNQITHMNNSIEYYIEKNGNKISYDCLKSNLISAEDITLITNGVYRFNRHNLDSDINLFLGKNITSKIEMDKLHTIMPQKPTKEKLIKI